MASNDPKTPAVSQSSASGTPTNGPNAVLSYSSESFPGGLGGAAPNGDVLVDGAANVFGTTQLGGSGNIGTIFEATGNTDSPPNDPIPLTSFSNYMGTAGSSLSPGKLIMDSSGDLFGTTQTGGTTKRSEGTVFELSKDPSTQTGYAANPTVLESFTRAGAHGPENLTTGPGGAMFGTTTGRGASGNGGTVFEVARAAAGGFRARPAVLTSFTGKEHVSSNILVTSSGVIGAVSGGKAGSGEIFELQTTRSGAFRRTPTILAKNVNASNLTTDASGNLYGVSPSGGTSGQGSVFQLSKTATGYSSTPTTLASFSGANGARPTGITLDSAGNIFGTTQQGGANSFGSLYEIEKTPTGFGQPITLQSFTGSGGVHPGANPVGSPTLNGGFVYGTAQAGGSLGAGELYLNNPVDAGGTITPGARPAPVAPAPAAATRAAFVSNAVARPLCFASGTRIRTVEGDKAVEALAVGDFVVTATGACRAVVFVGHRKLDKPAWDEQPVRVAAHAFGKGLPARDLTLSPGHPVLVGADEDADGGWLVPIMCLINGTTIERVAVASVDYWHVELDAHDLLLAEGLAAESYIDCGDRAFFGDGAVDPLANPDFVVPGLAGRCRPVAIDGLVVEAERRRLDAVFALRLAAACGWPDEHAPL